MNHFAKFFSLLVLGATPLLGALAELNRVENEIGTATYSSRDVTLAPEFRMELMLEVPTSMGSWVPTTFDDRGRLIVASHNSNQLYRLTLPRVGSPEPVRIESIPLDIGSSHGLAYAFDSLYVSVGDSPGIGRKPSGVYRLRDTDSDDMFDQVRVLRNINGGGQHGTHALALAPDGQSLFMLNGNAVEVTPFDSYRAPPIWGEDVLVPRIGANPSLAPQGWIAQFSPDGDTWDLYAVGMRNPVDFAFNKDGELFEYDADMEFDKGLSYYRPTHVGHVISGAEFGFRSPSGGLKWPQHFIDGWGPVVNIGSGSPTGVTFGTGARFPGRFQDAMFLSDWSYGNIYATFLVPLGSSYTGSVELFASGRPFGAGDIAINPADGSMWVVIGGSAQTVLYRITYSGSEDVTPTLPDTRFADQRALRRSLEAFHGKQDLRAVDTAWPYLASTDRGIRFAARTAIEFQDPASWRERALGERDPRIAIAALVALSRVSGVEESHRTPTTPPPDRALQRRILAALDRIDWHALTYPEKLDLLRAYSLAFLRLGPPNAETAARLVARFDPHLPASNRELNWELAEMLVYLEAPSAATKVMALLRDSPSLPYFPVRNQYLNPLLLARGTPGASVGGTENVDLAKQEDQSHYAHILRNLRTGWTRELREEYFTWFLEEAPQYTGGNNFSSSLNTMRNQAVEALPENERSSLDPILSRFPPTQGRGGGGGRGGF